MYIIEQVHHIVLPLDSEADPTFFNEKKWRVEILAKWFFIKEKGCQGSCRIVLDFVASLRHLGFTIRDKAECIIHKNQKTEIRGGFRPV